MNDFLNWIGTAFWIMSIGAMLILSFTTWAGFAIFVIFLLAWWWAAKTAPPPEELHKPRKHKSQMLP